jgi:hypothetical protein
MGNILNKIEYIFNIPNKIDQCLGFINNNKKYDINNESTLSKLPNTMEEEFIEYDIVDQNEIYPYTFSKQNK